MPTHGQEGKRAQARVGGDGWLGRAGQSDGREDGKYEVAKGVEPWRPLRREARREVTEAEWQWAELVVISACESGLGSLRAGEGVYGLKRAIAVSGARSSLLSLWKVDDTATAAFMQSFYQRLKNREGRAEALTRTQAEFRSHPIAAWRHPSVWAAFQLSGDWKPIPNL